MKRSFVAAFVFLFMISSGCVGATYSERGATTGLFGGAALGALGGAAAGNPALGALIGAGAGAFSGALIGEALEQERYRGFSEGRASELQSRKTEGISPSFPPGDPTSGVIINETPWELRIYLDPKEDLEDPNMILGPRETRPVGLDVGYHKIVARAFVNTQFGPREVGTYSERMYIDPKGSGWNIRLVQDFF